MMNGCMVTCEQVMQRLHAGERVLLLDVRTAAEFEGVHVEGARLMPLDRLDPQALVREREGDGNEPVYVICRTGQRAARAAERLQQAGVREVYVVEGGMRAWEAAGLPVRRGRAVMSLERQVRIAAGLLVVLGVVLGWLVHPLLYLIAAFVGGGLIFAGVTDTCGMAMLLAHMPWNRGSGGGARVCQA